MQKLIDFSIKTEPDIRYQNLLEPKRQKGGSATLVYSRQYKLTDKTLQQKDYMQKLINFSIRTEPDIRQLNDTGAESSKKERLQLRNTGLQPRSKLTEKTLQQKDYIQKLVNFSIRTEPDIRQLNDTGAESPKKGWLQLRNTGLQPRINLTDKPLQQKYYMQN